jgi:hypothetical protein
LVLGESLGDDERPRPRDRADDDPVLPLDLGEIVAEAVVDPAFERLLDVGRRLGARRASSAAACR